MRSRLDSLTGLRAWAALAVFLSHAPVLLAGTPLRVVTPITRQGLVGVTFFFALSGFVLTWVLDPSDTAGAFWRRRFARIYPAYFVALLATLVVLALFERSKLSAGPTVASFLAVQSWVPHWWSALNGVNWSLSCEMFFYLAFPVLVPAVARLGRRQRRILQGTLLAGIALAAAAGIAIGGTVGSWFAGHLPAVRILEFLLGCTVAFDVRRREAWQIPLSLAVALAAAAYLAAGQWRSQFIVVALPIVPFLLLIASAAQADIAGRRTAFSGRWVIWGGNVSYSFYLVHDLVVRLANRTFGERSGWAGALLVVGLVFVCSLLAAWALHVVVERPMERRLRGPSRRSAPVTLQD